MRGEHTAKGDTTDEPVGSPPHARGARSGSRPGGRPRGITPACAGSTGISLALSSSRVDHPRMRGEHARNHRPPVRTRGSPPHARGARQTGRDARELRRITPACAGSTISVPAHRLAGEDHPRMRGEHAKILAVPDELSGSPPHARGAHWWAARVDRRQRITPACAGSTRPGSIANQWSGDHPRMRGEHNKESFKEALTAGSPPHARGARLQRVSGNVDHGITPACAGSTYSSTIRAPTYSDHPRMRGEHDGPALFWSCDGGSPPHARGARSLSRFGPFHRRITPACAGSTL